MIVVSDTTPIISLIKINRLDLLKELFQEVLIPDAVYRELTTNQSFSAEAEEVKKAKFLKVSPVQNKQSIQILQAVSGLDDGESEAIVLAGEKQSDVLIIDERRGRKVAQQLGITITGTVGILVQANDEGMLSKADAKTCLNFLKQSNIRLSENLIQDALDMMK
ncbi:DUF3368 domain-containing protein [Treponema bryantii]|jgi:predicted nucleic acid-binding protein|uniref:DUF3368 domain-containing protein n=1 Tax=Treponema bryantii TaxID=163 RepID=UPI0003B3CE88|nr:DUF3368 domain-containing protein [Treponema bryantii]